MSQLCVRVHLYGQPERLVARLRLRPLWTELSVGVSQEVGFEDEAAAAVLPEQAVVQVHLQSGCLEVQSH